MGELVEAGGGMGSGVAGGSAVAGLHHNLATPWLITGLASSRQRREGVILRALY